MHAPVRILNGEYAPLCIRCWNIIRGVDKECFQYHIVHQIPFICFDCEEPHKPDEYPRQLCITRQGVVWLQTDPHSWYSAMRAAYKLSVKVRTCLSSNTKVNRSSNNSNGGDTIYDGRNT